MVEAKRKNKIKKSTIIVFVLLLIFFYTSLFIKLQFNDVSFEQLVFAITSGANANYEIVWTGALFVIIAVLVTVGGLWLIYKCYKFLKISIVFNFGFKDKIISINLFKYVYLLKSKWVFILFVILSLVGSVKLLDLDDYIIMQFKYSEIFEEYYIDPSDVKIKFSDDKKNLIYIFVESLESSSISLSNGGLVNESYIPNLEKYALKYTNFSNSSNIGGYSSIYGTTWTMAGLVSQTSGIPLKVPIDWNYYNGYSESLPGAYSIGEVLEENGYKNYFMLGSDASYGGRAAYFEDHGNYEIFDYYSAIEEGYIDEDYFEWWGYEDLKLFEYAKERLLEIAEDDEPFNFTMLTADTHFTDGYMDSSCEEKFDDAYANAFYCSDDKLYEFVEWIKKQDFYEDTVIVIVGDHLTMQNDFYLTNDTSLRMVYNVIINSDVESSNSKNRSFASFDLYPTTLAAMGAKIDGNKLGLGVNLYSGEETLLEKLGLDYVNEEFSKKSYFYDNVILGDTYYEMIKNEKSIWKDE